MGGSVGSDGGGAGEEDVGGLELVGAVLPADVVVVGGEELVGAELDVESVGGVLSVGPLEGGLLVGSLLPGGSPGAAAA